MIKLAPEGYQIFFGFLLLTIIALVLFFIKRSTGSYDLSFYGLLIVSWLSFVMTYFTTFFFRDPERVIPKGEGVFVSPADGRVILIRETFEQDYLKAPSKEISIFMSLFDVHVNRIPEDSIVSAIKHSPGKFVVAHKDDASLKNENIIITLDGRYGRILVRQVAGFLARRIVCKVKVGDVLRRGDRFGMIKFGSRLDVYLPYNSTIQVQFGQKVKAGETIIATLNPSIK